MAKLTIVQNGYLKLTQYWRFTAYHQRNDFDCSDARVMNDIGILCT